MTCIVAVVDNGIPYVAGDALCVSVPSQYHSKVSQTVREEPKVFAKGGMFFGFNGSVRMGQLLRYQFVAPMYSGQEKVRYLVSQFIPALQDCLSKAKFGDEGLEGGILVAIEGSLFTVDDAFGVCNTTAAYESIGQASEVAIGSLHTTTQLGLRPRARLYLALLAAERHTCVVSAPYSYVTVGMEHAALLTGAEEVMGL